MKQSSLNGWLNIKKEKEINICKYFYLEWKDNYLPTKCGWYVKSPEKENYNTNVNWKNVSKITICGYIDNINNNEFNFKIKEKKYKNVAYIKSLLQKAIRRGDIDISLKSALIFIKLDIINFLRRILIIMLEDVAIHHSFNVILWLLVCFSKDNKFKLKTFYVKYLLGVVYVLVNIKKKYIVKEVEDIDYETISLLESFNNKKNRSIIYSLILRKSYGGLKSDMVLIDKYVRNLIKDLDSFIKHYSIIVKPIEYEFDTLNLEDWIIEAIDYHCDKRVIEYIEKKHSIQEDEIRKLIWHNDSKINYRVKQKNYNYTQYNRIQYDLRRIQYYLLQSKY